MNKLLTQKFDTKYTTEEEWAQLQSFTAGY